MTTMVKDPETRRQEAALKPMTTGLLRSLTNALYGARTESGRQSAWVLLATECSHVALRIERLDEQIGEEAAWLGKAWDWLAANGDPDPEFDRWEERLRGYERLCDERKDLRSALGEAEIALGK